MRILFCGGGTAGHITPAIALAEELSESDKNEIAFVGRFEGKENILILNEGYKLYTIHSIGLQRSSVFKNFKTFYLNMRAISDSIKIIKEFHPDLVFGTGGYVCFPVLTAAKLLRIPTAMHESNSCPGLVTRLIGKQCTKLFTGFEIPELKKRKNVFISGTPVRKCFSNISKAEARKRIGIPEKSFFVLSIGGSGGAEKINENAIKLMKRYSLMTPEVYHVHVTGEKYYEKIKEIEPVMAKGTARCKILPFILNMNEYLSATDVIITRCGAITLSEIAICGTIPILIPSPNVADNHQLKNAQSFIANGAGILIEEKSLSCEELIRVIDDLRTDKDKREKMSLLIKRSANKYAREKIISEISKIIKP